MRKVKLEFVPQWGVNFSNLRFFTPDLQTMRSLQKAMRMLILLLFSVPSVAQVIEEDSFSGNGCGANEMIRFRGGTARLENDLIAGTDQNYTNGVAVTAVSYDIKGNLNTECLPAPVRLQAEFIKFVNPDFWSDAENPAHTQNVVVKFGQTMFTPQDHARTDVIPNDRPYAGLLYVGMSWNRRRSDPPENLEIMDTREMTAGVIGPWSLAEQSQNTVHDLIGSKRFLGWQNQLKNEPALQLALERKFKGYRGAGAITHGFSGESIGSLGLRLGNIETSASAVIEGRLGWNIPNDFGSYSIRPGAENRAPSASVNQSGSGDTYPVAAKLNPGMHLFGTLETKLVAHDFSLDGNLYQDSHRVTRRPWVSQAAVGISVNGVVAGRGLKLAVMRVYRTQEYEEQETIQSYGSAALSIEFN